MGQCPIALIYSTVVIPEDLIVVLHDKQNLRSKIRKAKSTVFVCGVTCLGKNGCFRLEKLQCRRNNADAMPMQSFEW